MEAKKKNQLKLTSAQIIPLGFLGVIIIGTLLLLLPFVGVRDADHAPRADHRDTGVSLLRDLLVPEERRLPHGFLCGDRGHEVQPSSCRRPAAVLQAAQAVLHHRVCAVRRALQRRICVPFVAIGALAENVSARTNRPCTNRNHRGGVRIARLPCPQRQRHLDTK